MWSFKIFLFCALAVVIQSNAGAALKILGVFPLPGKSHFATGEELMKLLAKKGHQVDVVSHFPQKKSFPNYNDISLAGSAENPTNNMSFSETQSFNSFSISAFIKKTGSDTCELLSHPNLAELLKKPQNSYDVIIVEIFTSQCYLALGKHFNKPLVGVVTTTMPDWLHAPFGNPFNTAYVSSVITGFTQEMTFFQRLTNTAAGTVIPALFNYILEIERDYVKKYFGRELSSMQELYNDVSVLLVNSHYSINEIKPLTPNIIDIAGVHVTGTGQNLSVEHKKWLDDSTDGCVYISFGSMVRIETLPKDKIEAFYEMFRRIAPVRVLMKIADPKLLPPNLPKNVITSSWLPQVAVLKHKQVKAFVTHGGLMGTQEAVAWGVPLVGIPVFGDQYTNLQAYANKKIAYLLNVHTFNADTLTEAVNSVLKDPQYKQNMELVSSLFLDRPMSPQDMAVYWVEYAARHGNRLQSPALKLTWYQFYLLDVYGFILGSIALVLYVIKKILGLVFRLLFSRKSSKKNSETSIKNKKNK